VDKLQIIPTDDPHGVRLIGEVDMATAPELLDVLLAAMGGDRPITIDMAGVTFIDSSGVQAILNTAAEATPEDPVIVKDPSDAALRVMELVGIERMPAIRVVGAHPTG
jgi:anti-sigma B factor antagonist